ncbi:cyclodeaminase/cyclohydrolase family protein [Youngiibacter multivorans]|uniref:Formiminotetrahydrofolate cyclodeaminase n=1 Tax=Youngiibacter multivorans TaxID=937251 RepID=A0ABS4G0V3_9CLOT|nr:cyclodeaminase/cyclohydrolase family protein [Youngiibacter multivorans]MBP1918177.1 formiminotetrahydrofolate cyclodeaminase [Youngiibacter multivorans]
MLKDLSLKEFTDELASGSPAPGGGAAAGLSAAIGASLASMVFNLTVDRKASENYPEDVKSAMKDALVTSDELRARYIEFIDKDADSFNLLMAAYKLPKDTDEEKAARNEKICEAKELVLQVPRQLLNESYKLYDSLKVASEYGNKNAISDAGVGAIMVHGAIEGAALNVFINLASMEVNEETIAIKEESDKIVENSRCIKEDIVSQVIDKIYGR